MRLRSVQRLELEIRSRYLAHRCKGMGRGKAATVPVGVMLSPLIAARRFLNEKAAGVFSPPLWSRSSRGFKVNGGVRNRVRWVTSWDGRGGV